MPCIQCCIPWRLSKWLMVRMPVQKTIPNPMASTMKPEQHGLNEPWRVKLPDCEPMSKDGMMGETWVMFNMPVLLELARCRMLFWIYLRSLGNSLAVGPFHVHWPGLKTGFCLPPSQWNCQLLEPSAAPRAGWGPEAVTRNCHLYSSSRKWSA